MCNGEVSTLQQIGVAFTMKLQIRYGYVISLNEQNLYQFSFLDIIKNC